MFIFAQVIDKYCKEGANFLTQVFSSVKYLEDVAKLSQYQEEVDDEMVQVSAFSNLI